MTNSDLQQGITIAQIDLVDHKNIKAVSTLRIGALIIHGVRVIANDGGECWVALPKGTKEDGYPPAVEVKDRELTKAINDAVLNAFKHETSPQYTLAMLGVGEQTPRKRRSSNKGVCKEKAQTLLPNDAIPWLG